MQELITTNQNLEELSRKVFDFLDIAESTRKDYQYFIGRFIEFIDKNGFNVNSLLEYKRGLSSRNDITVSSKNKYFYTAKVFLKELNRQGILPVDVTQNIKGFKQGKKHKKDGLDDDEVNTLTEKLRELPQSPKNSRLKAIISLLLYQGLRQIEIIRLNVSDVDLGRQIAHIKGKGEDDLEPVDLHPQTVKNLKEYLRLNKIKSGALFFSTSNNRKNQRLSTRSIRNLVKGVLNDLNIDKSTHGFRHTFTTKLIKSFEGHLLDVMKFTRHKCVDTLQVYNDRISTQENLPKFYETFAGLDI